MKRENSKRSTFSEEESCKINLEHHRLLYQDGDQNNRNLETKTNYLIALNTLIYSLVFYFFNSSNFELVSKVGIILVMFLVMFLTLDFVFTFKNFNPTSFCKIPFTKVDQNKNEHLNDFNWVNSINSMKTSEKAGNIRVIITLLFAKLIMVFIFIVILS